MSGTDRPGTSDGDSFDAFFRPGDQPRQASSRKPNQYDDQDQTETDLRYVAPMPNAAGFPAATGRSPLFDEDDTQEIPRGHWSEQLPPSQRDYQETQQGHYAETDYYYDEEGYAEPERQRGRGILAPLAVIGLGLVALIAVWALTVGGGDDDTKTATPPLQSTSQPGSTSDQAPSTTEETPPPASSTEPSTTSSTTSSSSTPPAALPGGAKVCNPKVGASATTTCPFAMNVANAVRASGKKTGNFTVNAYSAATKKNYVMSCVGGPVTTCTGGRAAVVHVI